MHHLLILSSSGGEVPSLGWLIFKTLLLIVILGVAMFFLFKYGGSILKIPMLKGKSPGKINLLGVLPLEPRRTLYHVSVGKEEFILASSENGISKIATLTNVSDNNTNTSSPLSVNEESNSND